MLTSAEKTAYTNSFLYDAIEINITRGWDEGATDMLRRRFLAPEDYGDLVRLAMWNRCSTVVHIAFTRFRLNADFPADGIGGIVFWMRIAIIENWKIGLEKLICLVDQYYKPNNANVMLRTAIKDEFAHLDPEMNDEWDILKISEGIEMAKNMLRLREHSEGKAKSIAHFYHKSQHSPSKNEYPVEISVMQAGQPQIHALVEFLQAQTEMIRGCPLRGIPDKRSYWFKLEKILASARNKLVWTVVDSSAPQLQCEGFVAGNYKTGQKAATIFAIEVKQKHRFKGLGRRMVKCLINEVRKRGAKFVFLKGMTWRVSSEVFWRRLGFRKIHDFDIGTQWIKKIA